MTTEMLWSAGLSAILALVGWILKGHTDEVQASINMEII